MGIILTNESGADDAFRPKPAYMKPDAVEEGKKKIKKLPADNSVGQVTMAKAQFVGGAEVRPNGMMKQDDPTEMCAECMKGLIGENLAFYMKAHAYHWNVMGTDFPQFHELFEEIYKDVYGSMDSMAEFIRAMGYMTPFSMDAFAGRQIKDMPVMPTAVAMATDLYNANTIMLGRIHEAYMKAEAAMQHGLSNFLAERMASHQKMAWQLGAVLGMPNMAKEAEAEK